MFLCECTILWKSCSRSRGHVIHILGHIPSQVTNLSHTPRGPPRTTMISPKVTILSTVSVKLSSPLGRYGPRFYRFFSFVLKNTPNKSKTAWFSDGVDINAFFGISGRHHRVVCKPKWTLSQWMNRPEDTPPLHPPGGNGSTAPVLLVVTATEALNFLYQTR